jgi:hypothetical protein
VASHRPPIESTTSRRRRWRCALRATAPAPLKADYADAVAGAAWPARREEHGGPSSCCWAQLGGATRPPSAAPPKR